jgi:hypothetical protein
MKYECCTCKELFTHTAKQVLYQYTTIQPTLTDPSGVFLAESVERATCPICGNIKFTEYIEPEVELEDVISVEYVNVGAKIAEGYRVKEIYAKSCTLVKPKKKVEA